MVAISGFDLTAKASGLTLEEAESIIAEAEKNGEIRTSSGRIQTKMEGATQLRLAATGGSGYIYTREDQIPPGSEAKVGDAVRFGNSTERDLEIRTALWKKYKAMGGSTDGNGDESGRSRSRSNGTATSKCFRLGSLLITEQPTKNALINQVRANVTAEVDKYWEAMETAKQIAHAAEVEATLGKMKALGVPDEKIAELRAMMDAQIMTALQQETVEEGEGAGEGVGEGAEAEKEVAGRKK